jgi:hypothetical protein
MSIHGYEISPETINEFRAILERDFGTPLPWSDEQIKDMAWNVLHLLDILTTSNGHAETGRDSNLHFLS